MISKLGALIIMNEFERYHFDLEGYILVKGLLSKEETTRYLAAAENLEWQFAATLADRPSFKGHYNIDYHANSELGVLCYENTWGGGRQIIVDDFLNASSEFDSLVAHASMMHYIQELSPGPHRLTSSELRFRYKNNKTLTHMGGPIDPRNRFEFVGRPTLDTTTGKPDTRTFNLLTARVLLALHDIPMKNGPLCVVPGSHKSNYFSPYGEDPIQEPGMIGIAMEAGDALFFTENLRHGGFPNQLDTPRRTIHFMIGPRWVTSQSPAHRDGDVYVSPSAWERYSESQRDLLPFPSAAPTVGNVAGGSRSAEHELRRLKTENESLKHQIQALETAVTQQLPRGNGLSRWISRAFRRSLLP